MSNEYREFMVKWNLKFPIDRWYREKHKIPFMSKQHRESSFLNMRLEWEEDRLFKEIDEDVYEPGKGDFLKGRKSSLTMDDRAAQARDFLQKVQEVNDGQ